jgi:shikimate dehydrogenase
LIKTAVIGHPIDHSLSPVIHGYWIKKHGLSAEYSAIDVSPDSLDESIKTFKAEGYRGFNVTLPLKEKMIGLCDDVDKSASIIKAINTVKISNDGKIFGLNTDAYGFIQGLKDASIKSFKGPVLILGAGGAARAVIYGLVQEGVDQIYIANRTESRSKGLALEFSIKDMLWEEAQKKLSHFSLVVNTTSLGMKGQTRLGIDTSALKQDCCVCDIVYNPNETAFLAEAKERGCKTVGGLGMLLNQARMAFYCWFDIMPEITAELIEEVNSKL